MFKVEEKKAEEMFTKLLNKARSIPHDKQGLLSAHLFASIPLYDDNTTYSFSIMIANRLIECLDKLRARDWGDVETFFLALGRRFDSKINIEVLKKDTRETTKPSGAQLVLKQLQKPLEFVDERNNQSVFEVIASRDEESPSTNVVEENFNTEHRVVDFFKVKQVSPNTGRERIRQEEITQQVGAERSKPWIIFCDSLLKINTYASFGEVIINPGSLR